MIKKYIATAFIASMLAGCAGMDKLAGMGVVTQETSTFDNSTLIEVSPNSLYDPASTWGTPLQLGARWSSATPDLVALVLSYKTNVSSGAPGYVNFTDLSINIDGAISSYTTGRPTNLSSSDYNTVSKTIYTSSENAVLIPYSVLERMVSANTCRLRIHTIQGYQDVDFAAEHIPGGKATAKLSIKEFMAKVAMKRGRG